MFLREGAGFSLMGGEAVHSFSAADTLNRDAHEQRLHRKAATPAFRFPSDSGGMEMTPHPARTG
jgi:hypothetical protein